MVIKNNVQSTVKPNNIEYDSNHVYVNSNVQEITSNNVQMYSYTVTEYDKDEFIIMMSMQLNGLSFRVDDGVLVIIIPD